MAEAVRHALMDGRIQVYRRPGSPHWQCACSVAGRQRRRTTGEESLARAKDVAQDWYLGLLGKFRAGDLKVGRTFAEAADRFIDEFETINTSHFLLEEPRVPDCRFHTWADCGAEAIGQSAVSVRSVELRSFFIDTQRHHCAHQVVQDRRNGKCLIDPIDSRTCCQVCVFLDHCWSAAEKADLPCGR